MSQLVADQDTWDSHMSSGKTCVVNIFGDWCGVCKSIEPRFEEWSGKYPNLTFLKLDYNGFMQDNDALMDGLGKVPTFQIWQNGEKVETHVGGNPEVVEALISKHN